MREELLQYIWRYQYFNQHELLSEEGVSLQILVPGELNRDQGPDFRQALIRVGGILKEGAVELHVHTRDWLRHGHEKDPHYAGVILHVVWENDGAGPDGIPLLVLRERVPKLLLGRYEKWMKAPSFIPCERQLLSVSATTWAAWKRRLLLERLWRRALLIRTALRENNQHWEETAWWLLARSLGLPLNARAFEWVARSLPLRLLARYGDDPSLLEALLLGQAGLLEENFTEEYPAWLQQEYRYLRAKHALSPSPERISFHRMRPGNFPTVRLAQLAGLLAAGTGWWARTRVAREPGEMIKRLDGPVSPYWTDHYILGKKGGATSKKLGVDRKKEVVINAFIPLLFAYGWLRGEPACQKKALRWLEELGPEKNAQLEKWKGLGMEIKNAADSQALLEGRKTYCAGRRCLDCAVGQELLAAGSGLPRDNDPE